MKKIMEINEELLNKYLQENLIFEFKDEKEFMDYVIYNCPDIPSEYTQDIDSIKEYFGKFLFEHKGKYYSIGYGEVLDVYNNCIEDK